MVLLVVVVVPNRAKPLYSKIVLGWIGGSSLRLSTSAFSLQLEQSKATSRVMAKSVPIIFRRGSTRTVYSIV